MAWESRSGSRYYYSATRRGGRVEKTYHGQGVIGELAEGVIEYAKRRRARRSLALAAERARLAPLVAEMAALDEACRLMVEATLAVEGFHLHKSTWRRRRVRHEDRAMAQPAARERGPGPAGTGQGR